MLRKSHVPFLTTVTPSGSGSRGLNWCKVSQCWDTNSQLELEGPYTNNCIVPDEPTVSEIAAGNM